MAQVRMSGTTSSTSYEELMRNLEAIEMAASGNAETVMKVQTLRNLAGGMAKAYVERTNELRQSIGSTQAEMARLQEYVANNSPTPRSPSRMGTRKDAPEPTGKGPSNSYNSAAPTITAGAAPMSVMDRGLMAGVQPLHMIPSAAGPQMPIMSPTGASSGMVNFSPTGASPMPMMASMTPNASPMPMMSGMTPNASPMPMMSGMTPNASPMPMMSGASPMPMMPPPGAATMPMTCFSNTMMGHPATEPSQMAETVVSGSVPHTMQGLGSQGMQMMAPSPMEIQFQIPPPPMATKQEEPSALQESLVGMPQDSDIFFSDSFSSAFLPSHLVPDIIKNGEEQGVEDEDGICYGPTPSPACWNGPRAPIGSFLQMPPRDSL